MNLTPEMIEEYFERYQWSFTRSSENTWITGVRTSVSSFRIFLRLTEHWVYFVINPFVVAPPNQEDRLRVYYHILRLNLDMSMAKFGLDSDGDIFLAVELPTENFQYSHFSDALNGISHHAERLYSEVFNLAHNSDTVKGRYDEELLKGQQDSSDDDTPRRDDPPRLAPPMDDFGLDDLDDSGEHGPIIAGKEVRIVDSEDGSVRIEFETAHDLDDEPDDSHREGKDGMDGSNGSPTATLPNPDDDNDEDDQD